MQFRHEHVSQNAGDDYMSLGVGVPRLVIHTGIVGNGSFVLVAVAAGTVVGMSFGERF